MTKFKKGRRLSPFRVRLRRRSHFRRHQSRIAIGIFIWISNILTRAEVKNDRLVSYPLVAFASLELPTTNRGRRFWATVNAPLFLFILINFLERLVVNDARLKVTWTVQWKCNLYVWLPVYISKYLLYFECRSKFKILKPAAVEW